MPGSPLEAAGAQIQPTSAAALHTNRMFTGLWTQRNPLRDAATPYLMEKFYSATRFDSLLGGLNVEVSPRLTLVRRPGFSVYNSAVTQYIDRFYQFRAIQGATDGTANISTIYANNTSHPLPSHILIITLTAPVPKFPAGTRITISGVTGSLASALNGQTLALSQPSGASSSPNTFVFAWYGASQAVASDTGLCTWTVTAVPIANNRLLGDTLIDVRDVTGPSNNQVLFTKSAGVGKACFLGVGNNCYISDGIDQKVYTVPAKSWLPNTVYNTGDTIIDSNGNLEVVEAYLTANITTVQVGRKIVTPPSGYAYAVEVTFSPNPLWSEGTNVTFSGLTTYTSLNGKTLPVLNSAIWPTLAGTFPFTAPSNVLYGPAADTGTGTSTGGLATGESGGTQPTWPAVGSTVTDGNLLWRNFGPPVWNWGAAGPQSPPVIYPNPNNRQWTPSTTLPAWYSILDPNNNVEVTLTAGLTTGLTSPKWITTGPNVGTGQAGGQTIDGTEVWQNCGPTLAWTPNTKFNTFQCIIDPNGNIQVVFNGGGGNTGSTPPGTWNSTVGGSTTDGALTWICAGPGYIQLTAPVEYAYSYHYISGQVTTASPLATLNPNGALLGPSGAGAYFANLTGATNADTTMDQIWIWRTAQGGSTLELLAQIPNPNIGTAGTWYFTDNIPDSALDPFITAPIAQSNNPPPQYFTPQAFYDGRIWGFVGSLLYCSGGPDVLTGNPNESFPPNNKFQLPSAGIAAWSTAIGLVVFRADGMSVVLGTGAITNFTVLNIFDTVGLGNHDSWSTVGNTVHMMTKTAKVMRLTTAQIVAAIEGQLTQSLADFEIGFPIGDLLAQFSSTGAQVVWHEGTSSDTRLFVADGIASWYSMGHFTQPEQCEPWSPLGTMSGSAGVTAIISAETAPGVQQFLAATASGPIWARDLTTSEDNTVAYTCNVIIGSIVLAQPGLTSAVQYITTEEKPLGTAVAVSVLLDEIQGTFIPVVRQTVDPPNLPPSKSVTALRNWLTQNPQTVQVCRNLQMQMNWPAQNYANEMLTYTIYGRLPEKARK